jgi:DNA-binding PadR family transcriptional regulator
MKHQQKSRGPFGEGFPSLDRDMARGIMKIIILSCIKRGTKYPYAILKQMKSHPTPISSFINKSDVYNMAAMLEREGYIRSKITLDGKKALKIYTITEKGARIVRNKDMIIKRTFIDMKKLIKEGFNG